jgi:DNA adenine methylase
MLEDLHSRLSGVVIECLDYAAFITRYDGPQALFYLDPPYWGCENDYGKDMFSRDQFAAMAKQLASIKGTFLLSLNDLPEVRETFAAFEIAGVETTYSIAKADDRKKRGEVLISNFALPD